MKHVNTTSFAQRSLMRFLNFAKMKKTWTWEICFPTVEKNRRSKQNSAETCNQGGWVLRSLWKNIRETRWQFSWRAPLFIHNVVNVWLPCPCHVVAPAILQSLIVPLCSPRGCCVVPAVSECNTAKCSFSAVCPRGSIWSVTLLCLFQSFIARLFSSMIERCP